MADTTTNTTAPVETPVVPEQHAPTEHALPAADAQPILDVLNGLNDSEPETQAEPGTKAPQPKKDGGFEPLGTVINHP
ncbi:hypothetical protein [Saccharothrix sp. ST-888]|uniref:hypothetical protein n=1 Tax=Saccharothrix sp. ST-888 TaxID=1427391 RepID=UPI0005ECEF75|nr:hypothetical protein [Saccharothrix sp. ST-888]KJK58853.1 hypothetical protein UK12_07805 [Saccharothrix sp. ST-888]